MVDNHRKRVAKGATLFTSKNDKEKAKKRRLRDPPRVDNINNNLIKIIPDEENIPALIKQMGIAGIEVYQYKKQYMLRRVKSRISKLKLNTYREYINYLKSHPNEVKEIQESLSINVTRFFRNRDTYEEIRDRVIPDIISRVKSEGKTEIRAWSAGCAVGAEPYSLAMIIHDKLPEGMRAKILASDINRDLIDIAMYGTYSKQYVAEMSSNEISRYFIKNNEEYTVRPEIKRMVSFNLLDLMKSNSYPQQLDLILCRNVLIYVDKDAQTEIINKFFNSLKPGGYLILGRTETLFLDWREHVNIISTKHRIYQKKSDKFDLSKFSRVRSTPSKTKPTNKRIEELRNFRKTFEERKKIWENRTNKTSINKRITPQKEIKRSIVSERLKRLETHSKHKKSTSNLRSHRTLNKSNTNKTPEEIYRELKRRREERQKRFRR